MIKKLSSKSILNSTYNSVETDKLINIVKSMIDRGAPTQFDSSGFNKLDYSNPLIQELSYKNPGEQISWDKIFRCLLILRKYKNTQLSKENIEELERKLTSQYSDVNPSIKELLKNKEDKKIKLTGQGEYGREAFYIPDLEHKDFKKISTDIELFVNGLDNTQKQSFNRFFKDGRLRVWQLFYPQSAPDMYEINPIIKKFILDILASMGYKTDNSNPAIITELVKPEIVNGSIVYESKDPNKRKIRIVKDGNNYDLFFDYDVEFKDAIKGLKCRVEFDRDKKSWRLFSPSKESFKILANIADRLNFDRRPLDSASEANTIIDDGNSRLSIGCRDISKETNNNWLISIYYFKKGVGEEAARMEPLRKFLNESIKFCFVNMTNDINNNDPEIHTYLDMSSSSDKNFQFQRPTRGTLNDYARFIQCCNSRGFNTDQLEKIVSDLRNRKIIKEERIEGNVDGFKDNEEFKTAATVFEENFGKTRPGENFKLKDLQVQGMQFLYSRSSALLGDETGTGKTIMSIAAAQLRLMKDNSIPFNANIPDPEILSQFRKGCLVFTLPSVVKQFSRNVEQITGLPANQISNNWNDTNAIWKILPYNILSVEGTAIEATAFLRQQAQQGRFAVCILDECHTIKNGTPTSRVPNGDHKKSKTTFNCQDITQSIPFVWGLSATIVANKPIDLYNQLKAINHPLGKLAYKNFKGNFDPARTTAGAPIDLATKFANADRLRALLILQRLYIQRTKLMMESSIPNLIINKKGIGIDIDSFNQSVNIRLQGYKSRKPINEQNAIRVELAIKKAPETLNFVRPILEAGNKVAIFTCFSESSDILKNGMLEILSPTSGYVATIKGDQDKEQRDAIIQEFKKPDGKYKAIVINIAAGGTGIDLPNILTDVVFNDYDWSPARDEQARGRFFRINSKEDINIHYIIASGTPDEVIFKIVSQKIKIMEAIQKLDEEQISRITAGIYDVTPDDRKKNELQVELEKTDESLAEAVAQISQGIRTAKFYSWIKVARKY